MKNSKWFIGLLVLILIVSVGCSQKAANPDTEGQGSKEDAPKVEGEKTEGKKVDGGIFILAIASDPNVLNPLYAGDRVTMTINNSIFAPLYEVTENGIEYALAEEITPSEDFLTYTLKLKKDLKWHDGEALDADDIVFTIDAITNPDQNANARGSFVIDEKAVEAKKIDELTVEIKLPNVSVPFMASLGGLRPIPEHIFNGEAKLAESTKNLEPIGSGPFKFKEMKSGEKVELVRFDEYYDGKANLDSVVFRVIGDPNSANTALLNGEISAKYVTTADIDKFKDNKDFNLVTYKEGMLNNMVFRLNNEKLQNVNVRKAIALGINKDEIVKGVYKSEEYAVAADSVFVPNTLYYTDDVEKYDFNLEAAKELLKEEGLESLDLRLAYINSSKEHEAFGLIMQQQLKEAGINLELIPLERGAFYDKLLDPANEDFDLAFNGYVMGIEPNGYKALFTEGSMNNFMGYVNKDLDTIWEQGVTQTDETKREELYKTIQKQLIDDMVVYPIVYPNSIIAVGQKIGGIEEAKLVPIFMFKDLSKLYMVE